MTLKEDTPIFTKSKKDFTPMDKITHVAIANKYMALAMSNMSNGKQSILRMNLNNTTEKNEIYLDKYTQNKLSSLYMDPTGSHLLISFVSKDKGDIPELMYLPRKSDKLRSGTKFRGNEFTAVAWNRLNDSESTTGPILLGTSKGLIFETEITLEGDRFFSPSLEQYWKQVFDIGKNTNTPINGLEFFQTPGTKKYQIFAATPSKLYYFSGIVDGEEKPMLQQVFQKYLNVAESDTFLASESFLTYSRLQFWSENQITPTSFTWITAKGIYYGEIDSMKDTTVAALKDRTTLIEYPKPPYQDYSQAQKYPIVTAMSQFHILLGYTDSIKSVCLLSNDTVYEDQYNEAFGRLVSVIRDIRIGDIWAVTENAMFRFKVHREERNVWRIFCDRNQFDLAKKYSGGDEACYNQVLIKEAEMLFEDKQYDLSARRYAETQSSFEEICLKFIEINQQNALKIFLKDKLGTLRAQDKTQITMIVIWVVELYLTKLEELRLQGLEKSDQYDRTQKEFETFMAFQEVSDCIRSNKSTIYELMQSHGDKNNLIKLTIVNKDFERLIRHHIFKNDFREALEVLKSQNNLELYYQFAPLLMQEVPKPMVKTLIDMGRKLVPLKLLPALVSCDGELHALEVIRYLEFCTTKLNNSDRAIHNFLVSLYAKYDSKKLMNYLMQQGEEVALIQYDVQFALRLCTELNRTEACVQLFGLLGLWESAVDLALKVNVELAKNIAMKSPENDEELGKKLWLKIAEHVISEKNDIEEAMKFLNDHKQIIKIEDILPFFSDFVTIDHFKDAICNSLKEYNQKIQTLEDEMEEATNSAKKIREEINNFRNSYTVISTSDTCEICNVILIVRPFYFFPCHHKFHSDCLYAELEPYLAAAKKNRLHELEQKLESLSLQNNMDTISTGSTGMSAKDQAKAEIDNILASECLYCGENMIRNIDEPFIGDLEYDSILKEWQ